MYNCEHRLLTLLLLPPLPFFTLLFLFPPHPVSLSLLTSPLLPSADAVKEGEGSGTILHLTVRSIILSLPAPYSFFSLFYHHLLLPVIPHQFPSTIFISSSSFQYKSTIEELFNLFLSRKLDLLFISAIFVSTRSL